MRAWQRDAFADGRRHTASEYRSIAFEPGAPHEKYLGWILLLDEPGIKVMAQPRGPVRRVLILAQGVSSAQIDETVRRLKILDARTDLLLHDFDDPGRDERIVAGHIWRRAREDERILNKATFVFDLARDDEALLKCMNSEHRRNLRKGFEAGLRIEICDHPTPEMLQELFSNFEKMARERGLYSLDRAATQRMFDGGDLTLYRVLAGSEMRATATVYRAGDKAYWMTGVDGGKKQDGAGRLLQFEIMRDLRTRGLRWYDFGGVASTDEDNGIFQFKKRFGGRFVSLGTEYLHRPPFLRALVNIKLRLGGRL
jgi:Acetyltransferase (GNAT) domain